MKKNSNKKLERVYVSAISTALPIHSDADALITRTAIRCATGQPVADIGEDTDLLILLCYHVTSNLNCIIFRYYAKSKSQKALGPDVCTLLLFTHAITGCDTT
ncbi:hypothetical protein BaRGS_00011654 [Batillaria attramentaria]|uniref:Uncharacterized protein n=1 Tax=Batillaria attramentaria TaxID=370345 RepID=A0ABD0LDP7_9CAEN